MARIAASPRLTIARRVMEVTRPLCDRLHARVQALRRANPPSVGSGGDLDGLRGGHDVERLEDVAQVDDQGAVDGPLLPVGVEPGDELLELGARGGESLRVGAA